MTSSHLPANSGYELLPREPLLTPDARVCSSVRFCWPNDRERGGRVWARGRLAPCCFLFALMGRGGCAARARNPPCDLLDRTRCRSIDSFKRGGLCIWGWSLGPLLPHAGEGVRRLNEPCCCSVPHSTPSPNPHPAQRQKSIETRLPPATFANKGRGRLIPPWLAWGERARFFPLLQQRALLACGLG